MLHAVPAPNPLARSPPHPRGPHAPRGARAIQGAHPLAVRPVAAGRPSDTADAGEGPVAGIALEPVAGSQHHADRPVCQRRAMAGSDRQRLERRRCDGVMLWNSMTYPPRVPRSPRIIVDDTLRDLVRAYRVSPRHRLGEQCITRCKVHAQRPRKEGLVAEAHDLFEIGFR